MATFISLASFTDQGIRNVKQSTERAQAFREAAQKAGVTVKDIYWTMGSLDLVVISDAPDDETAMALLLGWVGQCRECPHADSARFFGRGNGLDCRQAVLERY
jgi:uncharacterized protein with GYD domain